MINIVNIQFCIGIYRAIFRPLLGPKENTQILKTKMKKNKTKQNPPECIVDIVLSFETRQRGSVPFTGSENGLDKSQ